MISALEISFKINPNDTMEILNSFTGSLFSEKERDKINFYLTNHGDDRKKAYELILYLYQNKNRLYFVFPYLKSTLIQILKNISDEEK